MTPTARPPLRPPARCHSCGHPDVVHDIGRRGQRTACTIHTGPKATPCPCSRYTPKEDR